MHDYLTTPLQCTIRNYTFISCFTFYEKWCDVSLLSGSVIALHTQLSSSLCSAGVVLVHLEGTLYDNSTHFLHFVK